MSDSVSRAMQHPDKLGAGAEKRKGLSAQHKKQVVMKEWERGTLHSGGGPKVPRTEEGAKQAYAIAMSEARKKLNSRGSQKRDKVGE